MYCTNCGTEVEKDSVICTKCGAEIKKIDNKESNKGVIMLFIILAILILIGSIGGFLSNTYSNIYNSLNEQTAKDRVNSIDNMMNSYTQSMLNSELEKYNMAVKQHDSMNACVSAMQISQLYLELKDETNYNKWKNIEKQSCSWMNY